VFSKHYFHILFSYSDKIPIVPFSCALPSAYLSFDHCIIFDCVFSPAASAFNCICVRGRVSVCLLGPGKWKMGNNAPSASSSWQSVGFQLWPLIKPVYRSKLAVQLSLQSPSSFHTVYHTIPR